MVWLTGSNGAGKTTAARERSGLCRSNGIYPVLPDGDEIRKVTGQAGFDEESPKAHNLWVGKMAALPELRIDASVKDADECGELIGKYYCRLEE